MTVKDSLLPADFEIPENLETDEFRLRMLTVNDVVKDYDAVMSSVDHLQGLFGPDSKWPASDLSLEQNLIDLGWHQKEFQKRSSFAYTMVRPDESRVLGCVYIYPSKLAECDAEVFFWVRSSELASGLEERLFGEIKLWLVENWPFKRIRFPGRDASSGQRQSQNTKASG